VGGYSAASMPGAVFDFAPFGLRPLDFGFAADFDCLAVLR